MESTTEQGLKPEEIKSLNNWLLILLKEGAGPELSTEKNNDGGLTHTWNDVDIIRVLGIIDHDLGEEFRQSFREGLIWCNDVWEHLYRAKPELIVVAIKAGGFDHVEDYL